MATLLGMNLSPPPGVLTRCPGVERPGVTTFLALPDNFEAAGEPGRESSLRPGDFLLGVAAFAVDLPGDGLAAAPNAATRFLFAPGGFSGSSEMSPNLDCPAREREALPTLPALLLLSMPLALRPRTREQLAEEESSREEILDEGMAGEARTEHGKYHRIKATTGSGSGLRHQA